jgi:hypothetical protein
VETAQIRERGYLALQELSALIENALSAQSQQGGARRELEDTSSQLVRTGSESYEFLIEAVFPQPRPIYWHGNHPRVLSRIILSLPSFEDRTF